MCVDLINNGGLAYEVDGDEVVELDGSQWPDEILIEVGVRGDATLFPLLPFDPMKVTVPLRCDVETLVQYLFFRDSALARAAAIDGVIARINGEDCDTARRLQHGDELTLTLGSPVPRVMPA